MTSQPVRSCPGAVVMGDLDLVAPLALAGIPVTVVAARDDPVRFSRRRLRRIEDNRPDTDRLVSRLRAHARAQDRPPVLFYESDEDLAFILGHLDALRSDFRFVLGEPELVGILMDKARFQQHAEQLGLPVPPAITIDTATATADLPSPTFPGIVKPMGLGRGWVPGSTFEGAKARLVRDRAELVETLQQAAPHHRQLLFQQFVPGPETRIESYHAYVDTEGVVVAEFTGRKIRTHPSAFGFTTALTTTDAPDVRTLGRTVMATLGLCGVAKLDFKRDEAGRLWLLEVNPRFNLWHHVGAVAGCNLPALVYADLTGAPRPQVSTARAGATWCWLPRDALVARTAAESRAAYLRWLRGCDAFAGAVPTDPWPFVRGRLWPLVRDHARPSAGGRAPVTVDRVAAGH
ncbi:MAG TPA: ATP-grasp domain-containing protein [Egicoccus sp.]|nr:ATP-grasp domain-containing protein [Egicoccus sp.]HSK22577.1 ATP-grasp domain-containing protein [Egicoccus sp.]